MNHKTACALQTAFQQQPGFRRSPLVPHLTDISLGAAALMLEIIDISSKGEDFRIKTDGESPVVIV